MSAIASGQQKYGTVLTAAGKSEIANAIAMNTKIDIKYVAVGDGAGAEYYPGEKQDKLKNQIYQTLANRVYIDPKNPNYVIVETYIPEDVGGFVIREACIKTKDETVIAIGNCPSSYKPVLPEGSSTGVYFKFVLEVTNASQVTINIDQSLIFATQEHVDNSVHHHSTQTNVHGGTYLVNASRLMLRNEDGRCQIADPVEAKDATPKKWVEAYVGGQMVTGLPAGGNAGDQLVKDASNKAAWAPSKKVPTAAQTFYFRTDGNDDNAGTSNTAKGAFRTAQGGFTNIASKYFTSPYQVTLFFGNGDFGPLRGDFSALSSSEVILQGSTSSTLSATNDMALQVNGGVCISRDMGYSASTTEVALGRGVVTILTGASLWLYGTTRLSVSQSNSSLQWPLLYVKGLGELNTSRNSQVVMSGNPVSAIYNDGRVNFTGEPTDHQVFTVTNLTASTFYAGQFLSGFYRGVDVTFSGSEAGIGYRYTLGANSVCNVLGMGEHFFPGVSAGVKHLTAVYE